MHAVTLDACIKRYAQPIIWLVFQSSYKLISYYCNNAKSKTNQSAARALAIINNIPLDNSGSEELSDDSNTEDQEFPPEQQVDDESTPEPVLGIWRPPPRVGGWASRFVCKYCIFIFVNKMQNEVKIF